MKILTVVGARPQIIKASVVSHAFSGAPGIDEVLVHTGQHYDQNMSDIFFEELGMTGPSHHLRISGGGHGEMTGRMLIAIEQVIQLGSIAICVETVSHPPCRSQPRMPG